MHGVILGTAAYMAPEQARGHPADKRADMWAFGCVLYEMLTGRPAFRGSSPTDVIAQVITSEPDWTALPSGLPDGAARVLRRCLEKDAQRRLRDAGDARLDLEESHTSADRAARRSGHPAWFVTTVLLAAGAIVLTMGVALGRLARAPVVAPVVRTTIVLPPGQRFESGRRAVVISPDGQQIAYSTPAGSTFADSTPSSPD
jgi:hypothetical protein